MARIFISYSRADSQFIDRFVPLVRKVFGNDSLWYDGEIHGGDDWWQLILRQVADCHLFIYLISDDSLESPYCQAELREALRLGKHIFPIIVRRLKQSYPDATDEELRPVLARINYIDMSRGFKDEGVNAKMWGSITHMLDDAPQKSSESLTSEATPEPPVLDKDVGKKKQIAGIDQGWAMIIAAIITGIVTIVVSWMTLTSGGGGVTATADTPTEIVLVASEAMTDTSVPSDTLTPAQIATDTVVSTDTLTPTSSETPDVVAAAQTVIAAETLQKIVDDATATAAQATTYAIETSTQSSGQTATAASWTSTPTPNFTASVEALLTEWANGTTTQQVATTTQQWIDSWTNTPTNTPTFTPTVTNTPTATDTPTNTPLEEAEAGVNINANWTVYEQEFDGVMMVLVPVGCFMMGSDDGESDEEPVHQQCFEEPFLIDKYEVTNEQYGSASSGEDSYDRDCSQFSSELNQPRNCVTWFEARDYCASRGENVRLPTEAEWEYAARGPDVLRYPWGNEYIADYVIGADDPTYGSSSTAPVGSRLEGASWVGALDMSGNLWEWTSSLYEDYPYEINDGSEDDMSDRTDVRRVLRGGSINVSSTFLRSADRSGVTPDFGFNYVGFRCARSY